MGESRSETCVENCSIRWNWVSSVHLYSSYVTLPQQKLNSLGKLKIATMTTGISEQRHFFICMQCSHNIWPASCSHRSSAHLFVDKPHSQSSQYIFSNLILKSEWVTILIQVELEAQREASKESEKNKVKGNLRKCKFKFFKNPQICIAQDIPGEIIHYTGIE